MAIQVNENFYREMIFREFSARKARNPQYSLRAMARQLEFNVSRLSRILRGQEGLSPRKAREVASALGWAPEKSERFVLSVAACDARSKQERIRARQKISAVIQDGASATPIRTLSAPEFGVISQWYFYAILECFSLPKLPKTEKAIREYLGITAEEMSGAVAIFMRLGWMKKRGSRLIHEPVMMTTSVNQPSRAIRNFNSQILNKALTALQTQELAERDFSTLTVAVPAGLVPEVRERIRLFRRELNAFIDSRCRVSGAEEVYALAIQYFSLGAHSRQPHSTELARAKYSL